MRYTSYMIDKLQGRIIPNYIDIDTDKGLVTNIDNFLNYNIGDGMYLNDLDSNFIYVSEISHIFCLISLLVPFSDDVPARTRNNMSKLYKSIVRNYILRKILAYKRNMHQHA